MYNNILDLLEHSCENYPDKAAFGDVERDITFRELVASAKSVGTLLADKICSAEPVAFYMDKSVDAVCGMFGTVYAGGFYSFLDVKQPQARTESVLGILEPKVIFTDEENYERISSYNTNAEILLLNEYLEGTIDEEIWDVIYYALAIANIYDIDVESVIKVKSEMNELKYPSNVKFEENR